YADWLDGIAGTVPCGNCEGCGFTHDGAGGNRGPCPDCGGQWEPKEDHTDRGWSPGSGRVPDSRAARAEFIRLQCELARMPAYEHVRLDLDWSDPGYSDELRRAVVIRRREGELWAGFGRPYERSRLFGLPPNWL